MKRTSDAISVSSEDDDELDVMDDDDDLKPFDDVIRDKIIPELAAANPGGTLL
jgi:hypothetical protein